MTIIRPIQTVQSISFLGRSNNASLTVQITDKQNDNNVYDELVSTILLNGVTTIEVEITFLKECNSYLIEVYDVAELVYRGLAFCTSQTDLQNYSNN